MNGRNPKFASDVFEVKRMKRSDVIRLTNKNDRNEWYTLRGVRSMTFGLRDEYTRAELNINGDYASVKKDKDNHVSMEVMNNMAGFMATHRRT